MRFKVGELETAQTEIQDFRDAHNNFEIQISRLSNELAESSLYKDWYESKSTEFDEIMKQLEDEQRKLYDKDDEIMALKDKLTQETEVSSELRETIRERSERIKDLEEDLAKRPEFDHSAELEELE